MLLHKIRQVCRGKDRKTNLGAPPMGHRGPPGQALGPRGLPRPTSSPGGPPTCPRGHPGLFIKRQLPEHKERQRCT